MRREKTCAGCGERFQPYNSTHKYCSPPCSTVALDCQRCGKGFTVQRSYAKQPNRGLFCSIQCSRAAARVLGEARCASCGVEIDPGPPSKQRRTCGRSECVSEAMARAKRGDANPMRRPAIATAAGRARRAQRAAFDGDLARGGRACARPGCANPVVGQAAFYCSPRCHYDDRGRRGRRREQAYHRCAACGCVFAWNGRGKGACCSASCASSLGKRAVQVDVVEVVQIRGHRRADFDDATPLCRVPGCGRRKIHNHHVVYRQHIERAGGDRWHPDDALGLCLEHHGAAHSLKLPLSVLRDENYRFAEVLLGAAAYDYLRRRYAGDDTRLEALLTRAEQTYIVELVGLEEAHRRTA